MIEQNVQVLRCSDEQLWVRMGSQTGCTACDNGKGCGAGLFAKMIQRKPVVLELARKDVEVEAGQMLTLAFPEQFYMKLVFASYGWPLLAALAGALAGYGWVMVAIRSVIIDLATLPPAVSQHGFSCASSGAQKTVEIILNSWSMTVCFPSDTPNMCNGTANKPEHF